MENLWFIFQIYGKIKNVPNHQPDVYTYRNDNDNGSITKELFDVDVIIYRYNQAR